MSALLRPARLQEAMATAHLDAVMALEQAAYIFPWSRGNFIDSLASGYPAWVLGDPTGALLGYCVAMEGVDELHLLNLTVAPAHQGRGHGQFLLYELAALCRQRGAAQLWLEVRVGNARAQALYARLGFAFAGVRRGYYPAPDGQREDAVVMRLQVSTP